MELSEEYLCLLLDECILTGIIYTSLFSYTTTIKIIFCSYWNLIVRQLLLVSNTYAHNYYCLCRLLQALFVYFISRFFFIDDILIPSRLSITQLNVKHFSFYFDSPPRFSFIWGVSFAATGLGDPNPRPRDQQRRHNVFLNTIHFILSQCCQTTMMLANQVLMFGNTATNQM